MTPLKSITTLARRANRNLIDRALAACESRFDDRGLHRLFMSEFDYLFDEIYRRALNVRSDYSPERQSVGAVSADRAA